MTDLIKILNNPEEHYPGNFDTPQRANALLTGLCQDAANEIAKLQAEVLEQCRINGMSAEREDALRVEVERLNKSLTWEQNRAERVGTHGPGCHTWGASHYECLLREHERLKASIALDKMAENARELGLSYDDNFCDKNCVWTDHHPECEKAKPAPVQEKNQSPYPEYDRGFSNGWDRGFAAAQPAPVQQEPVAPVPHECQTEAEKTAYAFGWWKAMEYVREHGVIK
jgi:hypothetical protein